MPDQLSSGSRASGAAATRDSTDKTPAGPLVGIRVIELGQLIAGPYGGHILADFGAEVIKIEPPGKGDPMRDWGHNRYRDRGLWWPSLARNKKSVSLNLRDPRGQDILKRLVAEADVLLENFRPGTLERWGLGPEALHAVNPGLVIGRVSGYGQTGPYSGFAGFASVGEAMGGLRYLNGYPGEKPPRAGISLGDSLAAMNAVQGVLMALVWRAGPGKGKGQVVDAAITESCFALMESAVTEYDLLGVVREPSGSAIKNVAPSNIYKTRDGNWMVIAANADRIFERLCTAIGRPELATDPRFSTHLARGENADELDGIIQDWAGRLTDEELLARLNEHAVVCGPIYSIADIFKDEHFRDRGMIAEMEDPHLGKIAVPGLVPKLSETPGNLAWTGPDEVGAHNAEVLGEVLGLGEDEVAALKDEGVL